MTDCTANLIDQCLERYIQGTLPESDAQRFEEHYFDCPACLAQVEALQAVTQQLGGQPRELRRAPIPWPVRIAVPAAIAAGLAIAFMGYHASHQPVQQANGSELRDGNLKLSLDKAGQLHGADGLAQKDRDALQAALATGRLEASLPSDLLASKAETMLGDSDAAVLFKVTSPVDRVVSDDRPSFTWESMAGATAYRVRVYAGGYRKVAESPVLHALSWQSPVALARGANYTWTVTASTSNGEVRTPAPPQPEAVFQVMASGAAAGIESTLRGPANGHLLLAVLYAKAGAVDEARAELDRLAVENPNSPVVAQLKASLDQATPSPIKTKAAQ
jgi:hypothetical protein